MKGKLLLIVWALVAGSCNPIAHTSTSTSMNAEVQATTTITIESNIPKRLTYPPCAPAQTVQLPLLTPPTPNGHPQTLPGGLTLIEYQSYLTQVDAQNRGCEYAGRRFDQEIIDLSPSYRIEIQPLDMNSELVRVLMGGQKVFEVKTLTYGSSGLLQAWNYGDTWVIEVKTGQGVDIIQDGQSLRKSNGYDRAFAFQFLNNKPFYFFEKNHAWGINYDNHEIPLNYDDIPYTNVSDGMDPSIFQYQNMVLFHATRDGQNYSVVIGLDF